MCVFNHASLTNRFTQNIPYNMTCGIYGFAIKMAQKCEKVQEVKAQDLIFNTASHLFADKPVNIFVTV